MMNVSTDADYRRFEQWMAGFLTQPADHAPTTPRAKFLRRSPGAFAVN